MDPTSTIASLHAGQSPVAIDTASWIALRQRFKGAGSSVTTSGPSAPLAHKKSPFDEQLFQAAVYLHSRVKGWRLRAGVWMLLKVRSWMV